MAYRLGQPLDYDPFDDEDSVIDSPADSEYSLGEATDFDPFENDPKSSDTNEPDDGGHSLWDIPRLMGKGSAGVAKTASIAFALTNPTEWANRGIGLIGDLTQNEALQAYRDYSQKHSVSAKLRQYGETAEDYYDEKLTPAMKKSMEKTILASGEDEGFWGPGIKDPWKIAGMLAESLPSTALSMGSGALITKGLAATGFKNAPKIVQGVLQKLIKKYGVNSVAGAIGGGVGEGVYSGLDNANQAFEEMMATPQAELSNSATYQEIFNSLPEKFNTEQKHAYARKILSMATGGFVGSLTAVSTGILGAPSGAFVGKLMGGQGGKSFWGNLLKGAFSEGIIEEMPQSGMEKLITNFTKKFLVDPNQRLLEGTGEAMAGGAIAGIFMGGGMSMVAGREGKKDPIKPELESDAKNILQGDQGDITARDILLGVDRAENIRKATKGQRYTGQDSIEAEEEAGQYTEEELAELTPKEPKPPPIPKRKEAKPPPLPKKSKAAPGPSGVPQKKKADEARQIKAFDAFVKKLTPRQKSRIQDLIDDKKMPIAERIGLAKAELIKPSVERRAEPKRLPWDAHFRALMTQAKKQSLDEFVETGALRVKAGDPGILDLAKRLGQPIEPGYPIKDVLKTIYGRIQSGAQPRKRTQEMSKKELQKELTTDYLTGLGNKHAFEIEDKRKAHVASIDLDSLKYFNDAFGHQTGDEMLKNFGEALKPIEGSYHISGDEFIVQNDDTRALQDILENQIPKNLAANPITVTLPNGKKIKYEVRFSYGTAQTISDAEQRLQAHKAKRQAVGERAGRGEIPAGLPGGPTKGRSPGDKRKEVPKTKLKTAKHFTTKERAEKIRKEGFKFGAEKPLFGTGGLDEGAKEGRLAGDAIYLSLDDKAWGGLAEFEPSGEAIPATGKEDATKNLLFYDYKKQAWMARPGVYKETKLVGVEYEIARHTKVLKIDSLKSLVKAVRKYGFWDAPEFWNKIANDFDAVSVTNTEKILEVNPDAKFFKSVMADQLIILDRNKVRLRTSPGPKAQAGGPRRAPMRTTRGETDSAAKIKKELATIDTDPTKGQQEAGNYSKAHFKYMGFDVTIEHDKGEYRSGTDEDGKDWRQKMANPYGYFARSEGKDGDEIDLFLGDNPDATRVFVVHQIDQAGKPDEDKVMLGFSNALEAQEAYLANYEEGWQGLGSMTVMLRDDFAIWLDKQSKGRKKAKKEPKVYANDLKISIANDVIPDWSSDKWKNKFHKWAAEVGRPATKLDEQIFKLRDFVEQGYGNYKNPIIVEFEHAYAFGPVDETIIYRYRGMGGTERGAKSGWGDTVMLHDMNAFETPKDAAAPGTKQLLYWLKDSSDIKQRQVTRNELKGILRKEKIKIGPFGSVGMITKLNLDRWLQEGEEFSKPIRHLMAVTGLDTGGLYRAFKNGDVALIERLAKEGKLAPKSKVGGVSKFQGTREKAPAEAKPDVQKASSSDILRDYRQQFHKMDFGDMSEEIERRGPKFLQDIGWSTKDSARYLRRDGTYSDRRPTVTLKELLEKGADPESSLYGDGMAFTTLVRLWEPLDIRHIKNRIDAIEQWKTDNPNRKLMNLDYLDMPTSVKAEIARTTRPEKELAHLRESFKIPIKDKMPAPAKKEDLWIEGHLQTPDRFDRWWTHLIRAREAATAVGFTNKDIDWNSLDALVAAVDSYDESQVGREDLNKLRKELETKGAGRFLDIDFKILQLDADPKLFYFQYATQGKRLEKGSWNKATAISQAVIKAEEFKIARAKAAEGQSNRELTIQRLGDIGTKIRFKKAANKEIMTITNIAPNGKVSVDNGNTYHPASILTTVTDEEIKITAQPDIQMAMANETKVITPGNRRGYNARYAVVESNDLIPSHDARTFQKNPDYPEGIQERTYHTDTREQEKVINQAQHLSNAILLSDDPTPTNGPPIVAPSGIVLGGNSRTMSIARAYRGKLGDRYKKALISGASKWGMDSEYIAAMDKPVLVRRVYLEKGDIKTLHRMASDFNKSLTQGISQEAEIASMGRNMSMDTVEKIGLRMANRDLTIRELLGKSDGLEILNWLIQDDVIPATDENRFVNRKVNLLNEPGKILIEKAIFGSIIDDADLISAAPKALTNKIGRALPSLARIKARGDQWDITPEVKNALQLATEAHAADLSIRDHLSQGSLFGDKKQYDNMVVGLAELLVKDKQIALANRFKNFAADAMADVKDQGFLFEPKTFQEAFKDAFDMEIADRESLFAAIPAEQMSPKEYLDFIRSEVKAGRESGIIFKEKVEIEETGETVDREIDAVAYLNEIEDELAGYRELLKCVKGAT